MSNWSWKSPTPCTTSAGTACTPAPVQVKASRAHTVFSCIRPTELRKRLPGALPPRFAMQRQNVGKRRPSRLRDYWPLPGRGFRGPSWRSLCFVTADLQPEPTHIPKNRHQSDDKADKQQNLGHDVQALGLKGHHDQRYEDSQREEAQHPHGRSHSLWLADAG